MTRLKRALAGALLSSAALLQVNYAVAFDDTQKVEIEKIVREYLLANPEILVDMQTELNERQRIAEETQRAEVLAQASDRIFANPTDPILGNPVGDVTLVEFFDYNCGYCRRAHADLVELKEQDTNLRVVLKEFPILGPDSEATHTVSLALHIVKPDVYSDFMNRLISADGRATEESAMSLALELGADESQLRQAMQSPEIISRVQETYELANQLGITGTPSYVIGNEVLAGAVGSAAIADRIKNMRTCAQTTC